MNIESTASKEPDVNMRLARLESIVSGSEPTDEVDLWALFSLMWRAKWLIVTITGAFAIASVALALWLPNQYKATVILVPASSSNKSLLGGLAGQFGGLASIAGVNLGRDSGTDKSVIAMELVKTWGFLDSFIRENSIDVEVFAAKGWNRASNRLDIDSHLFDTATGKWVRDFDPDKGETAEPTSWELFEELRDRITVRQDVSTSLITLSIEFYSPYIAKEWVDKLVAAINLHLRRQDRDEARKSIEYLKQQIDQTSLADMRNVFYQLVEEQTKNLMLTEVSDEYVLKTLSPARVPEEKTKPRRAVICITGTVIGFILSLLVILLRNALMSVSPKPVTTGARGR